MKSVGSHPSGAFLLLLVGIVLLLLIGDPGPSERAGPPVAPEEWVCLTGPEAGPRFRTFTAGQTLGPLLAEERPLEAEGLTGPCRTLPLEAGTRIRLEGRPGTEELGCAVSPLPEPCRYLLGMPLNVNRAGAEAMELLPGIGPRLAARILELRAAAGPFSSPEDLLRVPGIGRRLLEKIQGRITTDEDA